VAAEADRLDLLGDQVPRYLAESPILPGGAGRAAVLAIHWHQALRTGQSMLTRAFLAAVAGGLLDRVSGLLQCARDVGSPVIYVRVCNPRDMVTNNPIYWLAAQTGRLGCGSPDVQVLPEIAPGPRDLLVEHHRMSAFTGSDLDIVLTERGIRTLVLTGAATNVAVESTARDAADRGYRVVIAEDCCAAATTAAHEAALDSLALIVSRIVPASAVRLALSEASANGIASQAGGTRTGGA
jgi:biuret amidohydrolase